MEVTAVRMEPAQISGVVSRQFMFVRLAHVFDLRNSRADGVAVSVSRVEKMAVDVVIGIENDRENLLLPQTIVDLEITANLLDLLRLHDIRLVILGMVVVILNHREHLRQSNSGNEYCSHPVMD